MIIAVCVDDKGGMLFNNRRQSRDRAQQVDLLSLCGEKKLWIAKFPTIAKSISRPIVKS